MGTLIYKIEKNEGFAVMTPSLETILIEENEQLKSALIFLLDQGCKNLILDLSQTNYISSLVLGTLMFILKKSKETNGNLIICNMNEKIKEVFAITNLDKVFDIASDRIEAMNRFIDK